MFKLMVVFQHPPVHFHVCFKGVVGVRQDFVGKRWSLVSRMRVVEE